jgi:AraC family transcriptional regulator
MTSRALNPIELRNDVPFEPTAVSDSLGWLNMEAAHYRQAPSSEIAVSPLTHHTLALIISPPHEFQLRCDRVEQNATPEAGSICVIPAGSMALWRWSGAKDSLHVYLEPGLVSRVAAEAFELDSGRVSVPALASSQLAELRCAMQSVDAELKAGGAGGRLAAESLANVLAVQLLRKASAPRRLIGQTDRTLPRAKHRAVVDYIMENLEGHLTLEQMAAAAHLSPYHFARQFKATTGLPPHQFVISRRIERARQVLLADDEEPLAQIAIRLGFADQSHFARHFKRLVGVTPRQFRAAARATVNGR